VRFSAFLGVLLLVVLLASTWATWRSFSNRSHAQAASDLTAMVQDYSSTVSTQPLGSVGPSTVQYLSATVLPAGEEMIVSLPGPRRYGSSGASTLLANPEITALIHSPPTSTFTKTVEGGGLNAMVMVAPIRNGTATIGSVLASYDLSPAAADQRSVLRFALTEAALALAAGVLGAYLLLRRLLGTVGRITTTAKTIEEGDLERRLGDQGTDDEVGELAATFDAMLDRIDEVMAIQRRLLADVSHQLKTPLTVIRGHLEVLARTGLDDPEEVSETITLVVAEVDHMRQLTEQLLLLGRSLERDFISVDEVDLRTFIGDVVAAGSMLGDRRFEVGHVEDLVVAVDEAKLRGALLNLIDNAVKVTTSGEVIEVATTLRSSDGAVLLTVDDAGPGIPAEQRATVLARFGRPDGETTEGSGLGLAIVGAVAQAHGGTLEIGTSHLGGLSATVVLPPTVIVRTSTMEESNQ